MIPDSALAIEALSFLKRDEVHGYGMKYMVK